MSGRTKEDLARRFRAAYISWCYDDTEYEDVYRSPDPVEDGWEHLAEMYYAEITSDP